jgi:hypothetical protein
MIAFHSKRALLWRFHDAGNNKRSLGFHVNGVIFLPDFNHIGFSRQILTKVPNIKFHVHPSGRSRAGTADRRKDKEPDTISVEEIAFMAL